MVECDIMTAPVDQDADYKLLRVAHEAAPAGSFLVRVCRKRAFIGK